MKTLYRSDHTRYQTDDERTGVDVFPLVDGGDSYEWRAWIASENGRQKFDLMMGKEHGTTPQRTANTGLAALQNYLSERAKLTNALVVK